MSETPPHSVSVTRPIEFGTDPVLTVLLTVADALDTDPKRIHKTLNDVVDTDALAILLRNSREAGQESWHLSFEFGGCKVEISGKGTVTAAPV